VRHTLGVALANGFEYDESLRHLYEARRLDAASAIIAQGLVTVLGRAPGRCGEAMRVAAECSAQFPESGSLRREALTRSICVVGDARAAQCAAEGNRVAIKERNEDPLNAYSGCTQW
jgi:hypothetical protein